MTQFFISFCTGCILIGALYMLCPDGNISKPVKHIFSLVFLIIIISAANIPIKNIDFSIPSASALEIDSDTLQIANAEYVFSKTLTSQNVDFKEISFCTDKTDDGGIVITKVIIVSNEPREKIIKALDVLAQNREVETVNE